MTCVALITAAGTGTRMGTEIPKQYLDLNGLPVLVRTLLAFETHPFIDRIVLTIPPGDEALCRSRLITPFRLGKVSAIVEGGATRQSSVLNGLEESSDSEVVTIHDGVRPLVSHETITATIKAARTSGAAVACVPVLDTVKKKCGSHLETVPRTDLWLAHTPQAFRTALILEAHRKAAREGIDGTDDCSLVEMMGHPIVVVEDSRENMKITTPEDLDLAQLLLKRRTAGDNSAVV